MFRVHHANGNVVYRSKLNWMHDTNMRLVKILRQLKIPRWSTIVSCVVYVIFMLMILCMTFPLKSSSQNKLSNTNVDESSKSEFSQTNDLNKDLNVKDGGIKRPILGDTVILSNSMNGNKLLTKTFYRFVRSDTKHSFIMLTEVTFNHFGGPRYSHLCFQPHDCSSVIDKKDKIKW